MSESRYLPMTASTELTSFHHETNTVPLRTFNKGAVGKPRAKSFLNSIDVLAVLTSVASLIASIFVIMPDRSPSWQLGFEGQIIVIGFLLSIMNLCMMTVAPNLFLLLEARWGNSRLQNYESILRNTVTLSNTWLLWRATLLSLTLLPLGLSVAYKRFSDGHSTIRITTRYPGYYGVAPPPMGAYSALSNFTLFLAVNASVPFLDASSNDSIPPSLAHPKAYGFNTLLIDNTSAALLDVPAPKYVLSIQQNITTQESWTLSASVNATVARYNVTAHYDNESWEQLFEEAEFFSSYQLFQRKPMNIGMLVGKQPASTGNYSLYCLLSYYPAVQEHSLQTFPLNNSHSNHFRNSSPMRFDVQRETCTGTWKITKTDFQLIEGSCTNKPSRYRSLTKTVPFYLDALPIMFNTIKDYSPLGHRNASSWRMPAIVTSVATMYWAPLTYMNPSLSPDHVNNPELYYPATRETLSSTNATLNARWPLYFVLCVQPNLTIAMFLFATHLYDTPITKDFGLVAILSGIDKDSVDILNGAALSGELRRPVNLNVAVLGDAKEDMTLGRIRYSVGHERRGKDKLERGVKYE
ncbi:hypothetical protein MMC16_007791 [Acarospora aff. strigata]|nr:hypothetical protein [Acarospora aff. strigata]